MSRRTPLHLHPGALALVFVGGTVGTGARVLLSDGAPLVRDILIAGLPAATLGINVVGSFLLGLLVAALLRRGPLTRTSRRAHLLLGTGFLGGFTTYSALALDTVGLLADGRAALAVLYGLGSVVLGLVGAGAGVVCGTKTRRTGGGTASEAGGTAP